MFLIDIDNRILLIALEIRVGREEQRIFGIAIDMQTLFFFGGLDTYRGAGKRPGSAFFPETHIK